MSAVFDASVVVKWFVEDPWSDAALEARATWGPASAPGFLTAEIANAFRRYIAHRAMDTELAQDNLALVGQLVRLVDQQPLMAAALRLGCERDHSVYDCLYAVLAVREAVPLVTADLKMARKLAGVPGLQILTLEIS